MNGITDVPNILVGHYTDRQAATGCTVVLCPQGAVAACDVRGGAPGTYGTDILAPGRLVQQVHGVLLSGGSSFGLAAVAGVVQYLEERGIGFPIGPWRVPIVPGAIIFDLTIGDGWVRPGPAEGYAASQAAAAGAILQGSVGAGTGATVGKALGMPRAVKGGLGTWSVALPGEVILGALAVVNAFGDLWDPETGAQVAGPRREDDRGFYTTTDLLAQGKGSLTASSNTTLGVIATNALLDRDHALRLAIAAQAGLARAVQPCHTIVDGDTVFALATGSGPQPRDWVALEAAAARVMARAVVQGVLQAEGLAGVPSVREVSR